MVDTGFAKSKKHNGDKGGVMLKLNVVSGV